MKLTNNIKTYPSNKNQNNLILELSPEKIKKASKTKNNRNNVENNNIQNKNEIENGRKKVKKLSYIVSTDYDKYSIGGNNKIYAGNIDKKYNSLDLKEKNGKNDLKINLKSPKEKNYSYYLNRKYYCFTEKRLMKVNIRKLNNNLRYLRLNESSSYKKNRKIDLNDINCQKLNYIIENINSNLKTIPYETKSFNNKLLTAETREHFFMEKSQNKKFNNLMEEDNILLNYFPLENKKINNYIINSNHIDYSINNKKEKEKK